MTFPNPELILIAVCLFIVGRYYVPPIVLAVALRDTNPQQRAEIIKQMNTFFRRRPRPVDQAPDDEAPPKQITESK